MKSLQRDFDEKKVKTQQGKDFLIPHCGREVWR
jgi:hypothetical protein